MDPNPAFDSGAGSGQSVAMIRRRDVMGAAPVAVLAVLLTSACESAAGEDEESTDATSCIDWVTFPDPSAAAAEADAVVLGTVTGEPERTTYSGIPAGTWHVHVTEWTDGVTPEGGGADEIEVLSVPRSCGDATDTLAAVADDGDVYLFLRAVDDHWETLTGYQGMVRPAADGALREHWPEAAFG